MKRFLIGALTLPLLLGGCASLLEQAMNSAGDRAGSVIGDAIGQRVGEAVAGQTMIAMNQLTPELTQAYAMGVFMTLYYHGGYAWNGKTYQVGDFTQWEGHDMTQGDLFEKAFLKREKDGSEWWRVRVEENQNGKKDEAVFEALFSKPAADGTQTIRRMRARLPGQKTGAEVPITEANRDGWVLRPSGRLTPESLKGATVGTEMVKVPAGGFSARHVRFAQGTGQIDWWLSDQVPGGLVKYAVRNDDGDEATMQLKRHGKNAKPML